MQVVGRVLSISHTGAGDVGGFQRESTLGRWIWNSGWYFKINLKINIVFIPLARLQFAESFYISIVM